MKLMSKMNITTGRHAVQRTRPIQQEASVIAPMHRCVALLLIPFALMACKGKPSLTAEEAEQVATEALAPHQVSLVTPEVREEQPTIELVGEIRAFETVNVPSETAGKVDRVLVEVGDHVDRGQPLVEVDRETYRLQAERARAEVAAAAAELELAAKELERKRDLRSDNTIPQATLDQAETQHQLAAAQLEATRAALSLAERDLDRSEIKSPVSGWVAERWVNTGDWADVGVSVLQLAVGDTVKVVARAPESWSTRLKGVEGFDFQVGGEPARRRAELFSIDPVLEGSSRSFEVVGTLDNDGALRPGMFATVTLVSPLRISSLWLPTSAVVIGDLPLALLAVDGKVAERNVQTGRRDGSFIEIAAGLEAGEAVIADVTGLSRGLPVTVVD